MRLRRRPATTVIEGSHPHVEGYADLRLIGSGGFSKVYVAYQQRFARTVALKVITADLSDDARRRFEREQQLTGTLDGHPHVIRVYESGVTADGRPYLAMEYLEQGSLADRVRRHGPMPVPEVLATGVRVACALDAAHARSIVHRDVKPQNILVSPFVGPVLADFGIAAVDDARLGTATSEAFSVLHVAPEVLDGANATPSADLYSLASTLWELLAGRAPFDDPAEPGLLPLIRRVRDGAPPQLARADVAPEVEATLQSLLARDPAARPADAVAFAQRVRALEEAIGLAPTPLVAMPGERVARVSVDSVERARLAALWARPEEVAPPLSPLPAAGAAPAPGTPPPDPVTLPPARAEQLRAAAEESEDSADSEDSTGDGGTLVVARRRAEPEPAPAPADRRRGMLLAGAAAAALLAGVAAVVVLADDDDDGDDRATPTTTVAADSETPLPPCPAADLSGFPERTFEPGSPPADVVVEPSADGTTAVIGWTDTNAGANFYIVFAACDAASGASQAVDVVAPGEAPEVTVADLSLRFNYCFAVGVLEPSGPPTLATAGDGTHYACLDGTRR